MLFCHCHPEIRRIEEKTDNPYKYLLISSLAKTVGNVFQVQLAFFVFISICLLLRKRSLRRMLFCRCHPEIRRIEGSRLDEQVFCHI
jgi:hypothetical protein